MHIASVTRSVPYDGIPHAGGDYVLRHAQALRELGHMLTFIAPDTDENRRATARGVPADAVVLYPARSLSHPGPVERLTRRLSPARVGRDEHRGLSRSAGARAALATADVVEYQWTQAADLGGVVARFAAPHARTMLVLHDVMTQQVTRQRDGGRGGLPARAIRSLKVALVRRAERRAISRVDTAVVFSEKDAAMARTLAPPAVVVEVVRPPLAGGVADVTPRDADGRDGSRPFEVLYVGWFRRADNARAALWLCREVWPRVRAARPDARLILAGADPTAEMRALASPGSGIEITGYQPSLDSFYTRADVAAVPVRDGAGVKFKTVLAMLWQVPVVSTSVGLEGITDDPTLVWGRADTPVAFADALLAAADRPEDAAVVARAARRWASREFSEETFRQSLGRLLDPPSPLSPRPPESP
ncbi:glycosyltransferase [Microbacterium testaceum]|uniref:glycosyltransferase n=1 Tax=Microbacterium testaceum TaxID=2033 RepID=UPI0022E32CCA|nr:glycosyltransferase [Microbacterium testaceum]